jgi:hypothetical protein
MKDSEQQIPTPHYTLIETSRGNAPAIVVVNSALRTFDQRDCFAWHLSINITCNHLGEKGMPTTEEGQVLYQLEDEISNYLLKENNAVFLARITCQGQRELTYRVHDPELANEQLEALVTTHSSLREWEYRMEQDPHWELAQPELKLLEKDPKYS